MEKKKFSLGLLPRILLAIILGVAVGMFLPSEIVRVFVTFNSIFGNFLNFLIPLIIVGLITPGISELGKAAGKWLAVTALIAYGSTIFAGFMAFGSSMAVLPRLLSGKHIQAVDNPEDSMLQPYFTIEMPPLLSVMTALVLAFVVGVGITRIKNDALFKGFVELRDIVIAVIEKIIIPLLPLYIFGIFLNMTNSGQAFEVIVTFLGVVVFVFILTVILLLIQYGVAGIVSHKNPLKMLKTMLPAYMTALGTSSSAATIPVTLRQARKMGVSEAVSAFTIPLFATIHLAGSTVKITSFAIAVIMLSGGMISPHLMVGFILMLGITMVAAPGVPGGAIMTAAGLLASMLGFNEAQVGLMIATYIAIDSFGTATNVTGDGALSIITDVLVARSERKNAKEQQAS
ncbi:dicarboxylate/amino acid:cation symporter [Propionimicrobium lymphophilum]|uniref:dicarboxylate/amino acid:cation symporter n=1 Tax=Propionimicrobium lymphophilum TaxID=33012 RepID=UPI0025502DE9|nr:dicarboxylate/amino acid:cation symporter [Propionimicrobium lymphophilum]MDK7709786.1 dicarboxylate/amino acid:cation symporter [Propionimicrobium lymphophilum]MDK7733952.1 dicarboxylate/amino acid:cation symporter [Propionimicrobium lymphophilum]